MPFDETIQLDEAILIDDTIHSLKENLEKKLQIKIKISLQSKTMVIMNTKN